MIASHEYVLDTSELELAKLYIARFSHLSGNLFSLSSSKDILVQPEQGFKSARRKALTSKLQCGDHVDGL